MANSTTPNNPSAAPRSPSPPPNAPVSQDAGPRAQKLSDIFNGALRHTISACSYARFASCFPTADKYNKPLLESVWRQVTNMIETRSRREFDEIFMEKDVIRGLNELDSVVAEAEDRKRSGDKPLSTALHELPPQDLFLTHLAPQLIEMSSQLSNQSAELQAENDQLLHNIKAQEEEINIIVQSLESVISDLEAGGNALQNGMVDTSLRRDTFDIDQEVARRQDGQSKRP